MNVYTSECKTTYAIITSFYLVFLFVLEIEFHRNKYFLRSLFSSFSII